jgi:hypothetical protein
LIYTAAQLRPLIAVVQDVVAHTFFKLQHTATVHYENGHYHLHKELKDISEEDNSSPTESSSQKADEVLSSHLPQENEFILSAFQTITPACFSSHDKCLEAFILISSPPPKG